MKFKIYILAIVTSILNFTLSFAWSAQPPDTTSFFNSRLQVEKEQNEIRFLAKGFPSALQIKGKGTSLSGHLELNEDGQKVKAKGNFEFLLSNLDTGISLRDKHMKEKYLEVENFPNAVLTVEQIEVSKENFKTENKFKGVLDFHGKSKTIEGNFQIKKVNEESIDVFAEFTIKLSDFGISTPSFSGITVAEDVRIEVESKLSKVLK